MYRLRDELIPIIRLNEILESPEPFNELKRKEIIEKYQEGKEDRKEKIIFRNLIILLHSCTTHQPIPCN